MKGHSQFDPIKPFRNSPVVDITWRDPINLAPLVKRDVAKALTREQTTPRDRETKPISQVELGGHAVSNRPAFLSAQSRLAAPSRHLSRRGAARKFGYAWTPVPGNALGTVDIMPT